MHTPFSVMRCMTIVKHSVALVMTLVLLLLFSGAQAGRSSAVDVVASFHDALIHAMKNGDNLGFHGRYQFLAPVIEGSFDLPFMTVKSVGRSWKDFQDDQRTLLLETYKQWSVSTYAKRFNSHAGESFSPPSVADASTRTVTVTSTLTVADDEPIVFSYKLREKEAQWRIVDIHVKGVSRLALTRSQFIALLQKEGFEGLIANLKKKIRDASEET